MLTSYWVFVFHPISENKLQRPVHSDDYLTNQRYERLYPKDDKALRFLWKDLNGSLPDVPGWDKITKVRNNAKYEFVLWEHKFSPDEKIAVLKEQILAIHKFFREKSSLIPQKQD